MSDPIQQFRAALAGRGIVPPDDLLADGLIHRCDVEEKRGKGDGAYLLHLDGIAAGGFQNWRDGLGWQDWRADIGRPLTPSENTAYQAKVDTMRAEREADTAKRHEEARKACAYTWNKAVPCSGKNQHPYLIKKGVQAHGLKETGSGLR
jgi:putative DNA primase/helicase